MKIIKSFSIFKGKQGENEKAPSHRMSAKVGETYLDIGAAWTRTTAKGDKFLSAKLADVFLDHTDSSKSRKSVVLCFEEDLQQLAKLAGVELEDKPVEATVTHQDAPGDEKPVF